MDLDKLYRLGERMTTKRKMTLKEAKRKGLIDEFAAQHEQEPEGQQERFDSTLGSMVRKSKVTQGASSQGSSESCSDTQTRLHNLKGVSRKRGRASRE